tara:strand:- start:6576 stop:7160 length:585 start_codon:yes stop_codon:yes gene_type:complete
MGKFIVFEGLDGAGLTTQSNLLASWLSNQGKYVILTSEPTKGMIGGLIRSRILGNWSSSMKSLRLLMAADLIHHTDSEIEPYLNQDKTVICDRYILSALAYGLVESSRSWMDNILQGHRKPDAIFYLRMSPIEAIKRLGKKGFGLELFERESYFKKVSENFDMLSREMDNVFVFNGEKSIGEVHKEIRKFYKQL